jgi:hypothetical protein
MNGFSIPERGFVTRNKRASDTAGEPNCRPALRGLAAGHRRAPGCKANA